MIILYYNIIHYIYNKYTCIIYIQYIYIHYRLYMVNKIAMDSDFFDLINSLKQYNRSFFHLCV